MTPLLLSNSGMISNPEEIDGKRVWLRIESSDLPLTFKLTKAENPDFIGAYTSTVKCTKYEK